MLAIYPPPPPIQGETEPSESRVRQCGAKDVAVNSVQSHTHTHTRTGNSALVLSPSVHTENHVAGITKTNVSPFASIGILQNSIASRLYGTHVLEQDP